MYNSNSGQVVVKRSGFLATLVHGLFVFLTVALLCATGVAIYSLRVVDDKADTVLGIGKSVLDGLPAWRENLPPFIADAVEDRREPAYRDKIDLDVQLIRSNENSRHGTETTLSITARNTGDATVSLLAARVVLLDADDVPVRSTSTYVATPLTIEDDWRGPLLPGATRRCGIRMWNCPPNLTPTLEVTDIRVWNQDKPTSR